MESKEIGIGWKLRVMLRPASFAFALAILLSSASLSAADRPRGVGVRLEYERGAGARQCPSEMTLRREVAAEFGLDRFTEAGPWRLRAAVNRSKKGAFVATANLFDSNGAIVATMQEVVSVDCQQLVKGIALWTSVQLTDPLPPVPPPSAAPPLPPLPAALPSIAPIPPPLPVAPTPLFRLRLGAATGIELGVGPTPTPLFSLNLALQSTTVPSVSLAFEVRTDLPLPATVEGGTRLHALVLTGSVMTCFHAFDRGILYLCPMFTAGALVGGAHAGTASASGLYSAGGARLGIAIPFASSRFAFTLAGDLLATLHPLRLWYDERPVWQTGPLAGALQAGVSMFF